MRRQYAKNPIQPGDGDSRHGSNTGYYYHQCRCGMCISYARRTAYRSIVNPIKPGDGDSRHGTNNGYTNHGCRCEMCREANREAHYDYMQRHPEQLELNRMRMRVHQGTPLDQEVQPKVQPRRGARGLPEWSAYDE